jgi:eukaryotic-like serine/threonine-protein kinase
MERQQVHLGASTWFLLPDKPLGRAGGFGAVFAGESREGAPVAIKRLHINAESAAGRELRIADLVREKERRHVIPILDAGRSDEDGRYYIVMARAGGSLRALLEELGKLGVAEALMVARDIVDGLLELDEIVHRDLKPDNVLSFDDRWCVADFGIARFVEAATSSNTLKDCWTPRYAAPEQWNMEPTSHATDVYALGCILFELIQGRPPFAGSTREELRAAHLRSPPPTLPADPRLSTLVVSSLSKTPDARPALVSVRTTIAELLNSPAPGHGPLAAAAAVVAARQAAAEADARAAADANHARQQLQDDARRSLVALLEQFKADVQRDAANASVEFDVNRGTLRIALGRGRLVIKPMAAIPPGAFSASQWDVVFGWVLLLSQAGAEYPGRSANLWFVKRPAESDYRWREHSYMTHPLFKPKRPDEPYAMRDAAHLKDADLAIAPGTHTVQEGSPAFAIDREDSQAFIARWLRRLAAAATGSLSRPVGLPDHDR